MGRYTTVQAYADNNANMRSVSYEVAAGAAEPKKGAVKPEKVDNPYGSTAGAGSGEFHVYRHARSREMARVKQLDEEEREKQLDAEFVAKVSQYKSEEEQKTARRRRKRQREKEAKLRKKNMKLGGVVQESGRTEVVEVDEEEFTYTPVQNGGDEGKKLSSTEEKKCSLTTSSASLKDPPLAEFANDGSFLELMKKRLAEEKQTGLCSSSAAKLDEEHERPAKKRALSHDEEKKECAGP